MVRPSALGGLEIDHPVDFRGLVHRALTVAVATIAITAPIAAPQPTELKTASSALALMQIKDGVVGVIVVYVAR